MYDNQEDYLSKDLVIESYVGLLDQRSIGIFLRAYRMLSEVLRISHEDTK